MALSSEADLTEGSDRGDREVALRDLVSGGPGRGVVCIEFLAGGCAQVPVGLGHLVADVAAQERIDLGFVEGVADVGIGNGIVKLTHHELRQPQYMGS